MSGFDGLFLVRPRHEANVASASGMAWQTRTTLRSNEANVRLMDVHAEGLLLKYTGPFLALTNPPISGFGTVRPGKRRMAGVMDEFAQIADSMFAPSVNSNQQKGHAGAQP
ncbi:hypothetical protein [Sodalis glossinidius]|uniref:hypothetical protein n=1 Tax=Sodalis glossinidius TaxID=63612 RepID=UPI001412EC57|nr:hypothetical protein [Sodalis glossinidius]